MYLFYIKIKTVEFIKISKIHSVFKNILNKFKSRYEKIVIWF